MYMYIYQECINIKVNSNMFLENTCFTNAPKEEYETKDTPDLQTCFNDLLVLTCCSSFRPLNRSAN